MEGEALQQAGRETRVAMPLIQMPQQMPLVQLLLPQMLQSPMEATGEEEMPAAQDQEARALAAMVIAVTTIVLNITIQAKAAIFVPVGLQNHAASAIQTVARAVQAAQTHRHHHSPHALEMPDHHAAAVLADAVEQYNAMELAREAIQRLETTISHAAHAEEAG